MVIECDGFVAGLSTIRTMWSRLSRRDRESILLTFSRNGLSGLELSGLNGHANGSVSRFNGNGLPTFGGSTSLQPPPRRRAWTASSRPPSTTRTSSDRNGFAYTHRNASAAETLGVRHNGSVFLSPEASSPAPSASPSPSPASPSTTSSPKFSPSPSLSPSPSGRENGIGSPASHTSHH